MHSMIDYFYIITITWTTPGNVFTQTRTGIAEVVDGESQKSICDTLFTQACAHFGASVSSCGISYYYLVRNEL